MERLQKFLSRAGVTSRRQAERLMVAGRVTVNGRKVYQLGEKVDPAKDRVAVDGKRVVGLPEKCTLALYKPRGVLTTLDDPAKRETIQPLLQKVSTRVYPVGRLDKASEGLLLLTNDGALAHQLMHPRFHLEKEYQVEVTPPPTKRDVTKLSQGIVLDGRARRAEVVCTEPHGPSARVQLILREGRKRQIRRMFGVLGIRVLRLKRVRIGPVHLGRLRPGTLRPLSSFELAKLQTALSKVSGSHALA